MGTYDGKVHSIQFVLVFIRGNSIDLLSICLRTSILTSLAERVSDLTNHNDTLGMR